MRHDRLFAVALALAAPANVAHAASPNEQDLRAVCGDSVRPPAERIPACGGLVAGYAADPSNQSEAYFLRGNAKLDADDPDGAIADFGEAIRIRPDFHDAFYAQGLALHDKGDYGGAIADYDAAIKLRADDGDAFYARGFAWQRKGDNDRAIADYTRALELRPGNATAHYNRAIAYKEKGDLERAAQDAEEYGRLIAKGPAPN